MGGASAVVEDGAARNTRGSAALVYLRRSRVVAKQTSIALA